MHTFDIEAIGMPVGHNFYKLTFLEYYATDINYLHDSRFLDKCLLKHKLHLIASTTTINKVSEFCKLPI